jgi:hypothetical protein
MPAKGLISKIAMVRNSTFGVSNAAKQLVLKEWGGICQIDLSTLSATITARLFTAGEHQVLRA